jgi:integrase
VETATRVRGRIERVWDAEKVRGTVAGDNPARWRGHLEHLLPAPGRIATTRHHPSMPFADVPAFAARLQERSAIVRSALFFTILTAARTDEVIGMQWSEVDLDAAIWTVPAERMKAGVEHVVPLVPEAVAVLERLRRTAQPFPLSNAAMLAFLQNKPPKGLGQPYTVHGFRASFRTWVDEVTTFHKDLAEMALAHKISDETESAYRRGVLLLKRRRMMEAWASYLLKPKGAVARIEDARDKRAVGEN